MIISVAMGGLNMFFLYNSLLIPTTVWHNLKYGKNKNKMYIESIVPKSYNDKNVKLFPQ